MNKNTGLILFILLLGGTITGYIYYKKNFVPKHNWRVDYRRNSELPYGLKLFYKTVEQQSDKTTLLYNGNVETLDTSGNNSNLIFIGNEFWEDSTQAIRLLKYVENGNHVFIAANYCPLELVRSFIPVEDSIHNFKDVRDSIIDIRFEKNEVPYGGTMKFHYQYLKDTTGYYWGVYTDSYFSRLKDNYNFKPLCYLNDSTITSFYIPYGKGKIIVHSNPILLTNFYMVQQNGFMQANNLLSQLHKGNTYWVDPEFQGPQNNRNLSNNPLKFLFSHPNLLWGWYLFLITIIIYLLFRSKREQRIIPLLPANNNTSIEYTKAIGTFYFKNKGHQHIAQEMYFIFLSDIRTRYYIATDCPEAELIEQLSARSGINKNTLFSIFRRFKYLRSDADASTDDLISLYNDIDNYHKKRK